MSELPAEVPIVKALALLMFPANVTFELASIVKPTVVPLLNSS